MKPFVFIIEDYMIFGIQKNMRVLLLHFVWNLRTDSRLVLFLSWQISYGKMYIASEKTEKKSIATLFVSSI
jgi:hypothetical protein